MQFVYVVTIVKLVENDDEDVKIETKVYDNKEAALKCRENNPGSSFRKRYVMSTYHTTVV